MISTRELAVLAGTSQSTVSRALNDHPSISVETKERIRNLALMHGYIEQKKNTKLLFSSRRKAVAILVTGSPFFEDLFVNYTLDLLNKKLAEKNFFAIVLQDCCSERGGIEKLRELIGIGIIEGFIILNRVFDEGLNSYLGSIGMPCVYLLHCSRNLFESVDMVDSDNYIGGYLGTKHLITKGHRAIITLTCQWREFEDRTSGYFKALSEHQIKHKDEFVLKSSCTYKDAYKCVQQNIDTISKATAIYVQSDIMTLGTMNALKDAGLCVPRDISVIGSDGYEIGEFSCPQFDSVAHPLPELVEIAVNRVFEIAGASKQQTPRQLIFRPYIISRGSVIPVPSDNDS